MTINSAPTGSDWFLNGISNLQKQEETTQRQISSGFRVQDAADAPEQTRALVALGSRLAIFQNWQTNLGQVKAEAAAADEAIGQGVSLVEQARALAVRGANATASASDRQDLASQVQSIQQQLVSAANATIAGRYIFGGDADGTPPYALSSTSPTSVSQLTTGASSRVIAAPDGETVYQPLSATQVFDHNPDNAFGALENLRTALVNNDQPGIAAALQNLQPVSDWLNLQQSFYGNAEQRIADAQTNASSQILSLQAGISAIRDTDVAQAAVDLSRETTSQSAAVAAQAQISRKTLFDYLG